MSEDPAINYRAGLQPTEDRTTPTKTQKGGTGNGRDTRAALFYDGRTLDRRRLDHNFEPLHEEGEQGKGGIVHGCVDYNELCLLLAASCEHPSPRLGSDAAQGSLSSMQ